MELYLLTIGVSDRTFIISMAHFLRYLIPSAAWLTWLTLLAHLVLTFGIPMPTRSAKQPNAEAIYPCDGCGCACESPEACWAGDCCCYTMNEKLKWAEKRGIVPPVQSGSCSAESHSCCQHDTNPDVRWVCGIMTRSCRGEGPLHILQCDPSFVDDSLTLGQWTMDEVVYIRPHSEYCDTSFDPPVPPPPR